MENIKRYRSDIVRGVLRCNETFGRGSMAHYDIIQPDGTRIDLNELFEKHVKCEVTISIHDCIESDSEDQTHYLNSHCCYIDQGNNKL
jgi:hypothetical protein